MLKVYEMVYVSVVETNYVAVAIAETAEAALASVGLGRNRIVSMRVLGNALPSETARAVAVDSREPKNPRKPRRGSAGLQNPPEY